METRLPLIVITGPTASGKTALAIRLAERFDGEIICADSRTVYRDMDIGTAKPSAAEQARVPHHGLDLVEPGERFSAADFKRYANQKIDEIRGRERIPFLVGGTGLYIDGVLFDYQFGEPADEEQRLRLEAKTLTELHAYCVENNIELPSNAANKRYVIRAIEQQGINQKRRSNLIDNVIVVGITSECETLRCRICQRAEQLFESGVVEEAILLGKKYGWNSEAMTGNIYPLVKKYLDHELTETELKQKFMTADWRLAKRQLTWLKRNEFIRWLDLETAEHYLVTTLARLS